MQAGSKIKSSQKAAIAAIALMALPLALPATLQEPRQNDSQHVYLEHALTLFKQDADSFMILSGDVRFRKQGMLMYCDSAHFFPESESFDAYGNVRMEQGDTLFVYADSMHYRSESQKAVLYGMPVRMINKNVELRTDVFTYDLYYEYGFYEYGGTLIDEKNELVSIEGEYVTTTKEATFYRDVKLTSVSEGESGNDTMYIYTDTLYYNTDTHIAELNSSSEIINKADTIFTTFGVYDTNTEIAELYDRSIVRMGRGTTLEGDTLFYDRPAGYGWARGNMVMTDSARQSSLSGDYGYYDQLIDSCYVTGRALMKEYSGGDTLFMHGREVISYAVVDTIKFEADSIMGTPAYEKMDTSHVVLCYPRVRFYRSDMQGVCDSMRFEEKDSVLYMYRHPVIWSDDRQIFGNVIELHLNDSTIDEARLPNFGFSAQHVEENFFNQLSGKEMIAHFDGKEMRRLEVNGNVEAIMLPMENDSTFNKILNLESSYLDAEFKNQNLVRMKTWPETSGTVTPLYLAKKSLFFLSRFEWYHGIRPEDPEDVFVIPKEMEDLMNSPEVAVGISGKK